MASIRHFNYTNSKGETNEHTIFALSETPDYLMGIDVNKVLEQIVDKNDKDFKGEGHSPWCFNLIRADMTYPDNDGKSELTLLNKTNLVNIAAARCLWEDESAQANEHDELIYSKQNNLILYNKDHSEIDYNKLISFISKNKIEDGTSLTNAIENAAKDDSNEFYLFALNLSWFSYACLEDEEPALPGFFEMVSAYKLMMKVLLVRDPTQYKDLKESRAAGKKPIEGFDESWMKAFKNFKKVNIKEIA